MSLLFIVGDVVAKWLVRRTLRPEGQEFEPWLVHPCCVLRPYLYLSKAMFPSVDAKHNCAQVEFEYFIIKQVLFIAC